MYVCSHYEELIKCCLCHWLGSAWLLALRIFYPRYDRRNDVVISVIYRVLNL